MEKTNLQRKRVLAKMPEAHWHLQEICSLGEEEKPYKPTHRV